jgi:hypothetical protein
MHAGPGSNPIVGYILLGLAIPFFTYVVVRASRRQREVERVANSDESSVTLFERSLPVTKYSSPDSVLHKDMSALVIVRDSSIEIAESNIGSALGTHWLLDPRETIFELASEARFGAKRVGWVVVEGSQLVAGPSVQIALNAGSATSMLREALRQAGAQELQ